MVQKALSIASMVMDELTSQPLCYHFSSCLLVNLPSESALAVSLLLASLDLSCLMATILWLFGAVLPLSRASVVLLTIRVLEVAVHPLDPRYRLRCKGFETSALMQAYGRFRQQSRQRRVAR